MKRINLILLPLFILIFLNGCVGQPQRIATTNSGMPEIEIYTQDRNLIKSNIIDGMFSSGKGYMIINESDNNIIFLREPNGFAADLAQAFMVGASGERPKVEVSFTITKRTNSFIVYSQIAQVYKDRFGKTTRIDATQNNKNFNDIYTFLNNIKNKVEKK